MYKNCIRFHVVLNVEYTFKVCLIFFTHAAGNQYLSYLFMNTDVTFLFNDFLLKSVYLGDKEQPFALLFR